MIGWQDRGLKMDTKLYASGIAAQKDLLRAQITHRPEDLRKYLLVSLKALKAE
jgi:aflatoxin B1 aldehyde reductase